MSSVLAKRSGRSRSYPLAAAAVIAACSIVFIEDGLAIPYADASGSSKMVGLAPYEADNSSGADKAISVEVEHDELLLLNAGDVDETHLGSTVYFSAVNTVSISSATNTRPIAGTVTQLEDGLVWVKPEVQ
jgi:hypothetical protein